MPWFYATVFTPDGKPSSIDFGGSGSESVAARIALRISNQMQRDTCVAMVKKDIVVVLQTIRWKGYAAPVETLEVQDVEPRHIRVSLNPGEPTDQSQQLYEFIDKWTLKGHAVTVSRCAGNPGFVNAVASR